MNKFLEILKLIKEKIFAFFKKHNEVFNPIAVLTAICLVVALLLSLTNLITKGKIAAMDKKASDDAMSALIIAETYENVKLGKNGQVYLAKSGDTAKGYIVGTSASGYGGDIKIMVAISIDKKVLGIKILSAADETPGLGQNVTKESFYSQFVGKTENIVVVKNSAESSKNEIDAVTGATISSRAVTSAVNEAFCAVDEYLKTLAPETTPSMEVQQ